MHTLKKTWITRLLLPVLFFSCASLAQEDSSLDKSVATQGGFHWLEEQRDYLGGLVTRSGKGIDHFAARDSFKAGLENHSYVRVRLKEKFSEGDDEGFDYNVNARIDLPNFKKHARLFFDTEPEDIQPLSDQRRDVTLSDKDEDADGSSDDDTADDKSVAGVEFTGKKRFNWRPKILLGASLSSPMDPYIKAAVRRYDELPGPWQSRLGQSVYYYEREHVGATTDFDVYRPVGINKVFRLSSQAQYLNKDNAWELYQGVSLYQRINLKNSIEYEVAGIAESQPHLRGKSYWLRMQWRHSLYKDWLYFKLSPELLFPRDRDFDITPGILFQLEIFFSGAPVKSRI